MLDCGGAATSPASYTFGPNLACTKNFEYVPVARCGTIPGSLEMRYDPLLCSLVRAAARGPSTRNPTLILVLTYPVRRSEMEKGVACPPWWLTVLLGVHSSSQVAHGDINAGGQPHPDLTEMLKGSAEPSWDSTPSPSRPLKSGPVVWMGTSDDFEAVTVDDLLEPSPSPSSDSEEEEWSRQEPKGKTGSRRQLGKKSCGGGKGKTQEACNPLPPPPRPPPPPPSPAPPPPPPPSPPPPPACPWEVGPNQCGNEGATNKDTCVKHFYEKHSGDWRQCIWAPPICKAGGFSCKVKAEGKAGCNCPATCPKKLPFLSGNVGANCKVQNANRDNCARCPCRHYIL